VKGYLKIAISIRVWVLEVVNLKVILKSESFFFYFHFYISLIYIDNLSFGLAAGKAKG